MTKKIRLLNHKLLYSVFLFTFLSLLFSIVVSSLPMQSYAEAPAMPGHGWIMRDAANSVSNVESEAMASGLTSVDWEPASVATAVSVTEATAEAPEIAALARGLQHDPKLIYDYVHNHIDYVPYFGLQKSAAKTYMDGIGNDFDQAALMIALLRASGFTAQFLYGTMTIPGSNLINWLGINFNVPLIAEVFHWSSIPYSYPSSDGTTNVKRVWVKATINGADYVFDPAFKMYDYTGKIDLGAATGYDRNTFINAATAGANVGGNYVQNLNELNVVNKLKEYSGNLATKLKSQYPNSDLKEIIGGRSIVQTNIDQYQTTLPFATSIEQTWDDIPSNYTTAIRIELRGINHTFLTPEIDGKRLTITYDAANRPELRLDGVLVATGSSTPDGRYELYTHLTHPYWGTYGDHSSTYWVKSGPGYTYAIVTQFGSMSEAVIEKRQKILEEFLDQGLSDTSEEVLGESMSIVGLIYLYQVSLANSLVANLADTISIIHHSVLLVVKENGYYIDNQINFINPHSIHNTTASDWKDHFNTLMTFMSGIEQATLEQLSSPVIPALSTIKLFQIANEGGYKIFAATLGNWSSVRGQLQNYSTENLAYLDWVISLDRNQTLYVPESGQLGMGGWSGSAFIYSHPNEVWMAITGGHAGAYLSQPAYSPPASIGNFIDMTIVSDSQKVEHSPPLSVEPVVMSNGEYIYDRTDIALGRPAPFGLAFARSYNSGRNFTDRTLGYGWTHNYDIYLDRIGHGAPGLGKQQPIDSAALITDLYVTFDVLKNENNVKGWVATTLAHKWAVDQLVDNAIFVHLGSKVIEYIKLPDGTYSPPPGITTQLMDNGNDTFSLQERFGTRMDFNTDGLLASLEDVDNNTMSFSYTGSNLSTVQDSFGHTLTLAYSGDHVSSVTDSTGRSVTYGYDVNGDLTTFTDLDNKTWNYGYDNHRMTSLQNPLGITTATNTYDTLGRVDTQTVPRQSGTDAIYNFYFSGFRNVEEDPDGNQIIYYFDEKGRYNGRENALGYKYKKEFDGQNHTVKTTDPRSSETVFQYDGEHNLTNIFTALNEEYTIGYDAQFRPTSVTDPLSYSTFFGYDSGHHLTSITDAEDNTIEATYYANGLVNTTTDARSVTSTYTYDIYGNPQTTQTAGHPVVDYDFYPVGRMNFLIDQEGAMTGFEYKDSGLVSKRIDPLTKETIAIYDDTGRLSFITDRNLESISYEYTPTGKPDKITYPDLSEVNFVYNQHDKLTSMIDPAGTTSYVYDTIHRLTSMTDANGFTVSYEYDEANNLTKITYPGNKAVTYMYDELNRLETVTNWLSQTATYTYDTAGHLTGLTNFNGTTTAYEYDDADRLTSLENRKSGNSVLSTYSFTLDGNGNRTQIIRDEPLSPSLQSEGVDYTYNAQKNRLLTAGTSSFSHDDEGQLSDKDGVLYDFDYEHRLVDIGVGATTFIYDGVGNRLRATRSGVETKYIYDAFGNLLAKADSADTITRYYIHGFGLLAMVTSADQSYTYHYNAIGNTIAITDQTGTIINRYAYTPFGRLANEEETIQQPFKFVGKYGIMSEPDGLYYMRARYCDAETGRFISEDPIGFAGGDVNLYAYVQNNPVMFIDPSGESIWAPWVGLGAGLASGVWSFGSEFLMTGDMWKAGQKAIVDGVTTGVGVGVASTIVGAYGAIPAAAATNALMQKLVYGEVKTADVIISSVSNTIVGVAISRSVKDLAIESVLGAMGRGAAAGYFSALGSSVLSYGNQAVFGGTGGNNGCNN